VFLKAFQRFDAIGSSPSVAGWLKTVTRNACLNHLSRYRSRWRLFSELEGPGGEQWDPPAVPLADPDRSDRRDDLELALQRLPDHQRVPLVLFHFEEVSYQEIARTLGVSLAKVKIDIHRGREALRKLLSDHAPR